MPIEEIEKLEKELMFKVYLRRNWFHSLNEYYELFGNNLEKREIAVKDYLETYNRKHDKS